LYAYYFVVINFKLNLRFFCRVCVCVSVLPKTIFLPSFTVVVHKCHFLILVGVFCAEWENTLFIKKRKTNSSTSDKVENVQTKN